MTKLCYQALLLGELKVKHNRHHRPLVWVRQLQWTCPVKVTPEKRLACIFTLFCNINAVYTRSFTTIKLYHQPTHAHRHAVAAALRPSEHNERRSLHDRFDMKHHRALYTWSTAEPRYASIVQRLERNKRKECWCWLWTPIIREHKDCIMQIWVERDLKCLLTMSQMWPINECQMCGCVGVWVCE